MKNNSNFPPSEFSWPPLFQHIPEPINSNFGSPHYSKNDSQQTANELLNFRDVYFLALWLCTKADADDDDFTE